MLGDNVEHLADRNRAVADRAAHETIAFVGELDPIILEMDVSEMRGDATGEVQRRLGDGEGVAHVEANADAAVGLAESDQLVGAEILMILDRELAALVRGARSIYRQRLADIANQLGPTGAKRVTIPAQHRRQSEPDRVRAERARGAHRAVERAHHQAGTDDGSHVQLAQPFSQRRQFAVAHGAQPGIENLDRARAEFLGDGDEAFQPGAFRIGARAAGALQAEVVGQAVRVEAQFESSASFGVHLSPASTVMDCLVIMRLSSEARNKAVRAISSPSSVRLMA
jgi:hypothetical protein